ncbi:MAG: initiation factor 2B [Halobacteriales archaeon SW_9_67_25]|nr:MAG: initiation factor 2B [Halobacteriales archaeon SW_9_67_25]
MIDETAGEIADMQTHSSSVVAVKAARALRELTEREFPTVEEYLQSLDRNSSILRRANPSHASLHNTQSQIVGTVTDADPDTVTEAQELTLDAIEDVTERVERGKQQAATRAGELLAGDETLLTHDYSTTVLSAIEAAVDAGATFTVYVTEARPRYLGRKMARQLAEIEAVETHLVVDSASGHYLPECDRVVFGMSCIVDDRLYNRVGTYPIAATAADVGVPVTVVGSAAKLVDSGLLFENEQRPASEVMLEPAQGFEIDNPAYDATPTRLLDSVVTGEGIHDPGSG